MIKWLPFLFCFLLFGTSGLAQTVINVDLTASPNITKTYTGYDRWGTDCRGTNCIVFNITLNPGSDLVNFNTSQITGASFYTIDCGDLTPVGTPACISGKTQVRVSFCKVGGNDVTYTITASTTVKASDDITVRAGCSTPLSVVGLDPVTAIWTSIFPGVEGAYNSMLSCTSGCASNTFTPGLTAPPYIDYRVSGTVSNCPNSRSDVVRVYVVPGMAVSFAAGNTVICSGAAATLSANVTGGNSPYTYSWKKDGAPISNTTPSISVFEIGTYEVSVGDNTNCTPVTQSIAVTAAPTPAAPTADGIAVCAGSTATLNATAPGGAYEWYDAAAGGNLLGSGATYITLPLYSNKTYYVETIVGGCRSPRTTVNVTVNPIPDAPTVADITICSGNTGTLTATGPGGIYEWYTDPSGGTPLPGTDTFTTPVLSSTTTYYVQTTINGCTSARTAVTVTVNPTPVAPTALGAAICNNTSTTLVATAPGGNYEWYDVASGGIPLIASSAFTTPALTATTTYYVQTIVSGCPSARTAVTVLVDAIPDSPTISGVAICNGTSTTLTPTAPGGMYQWFSQASGGTALATAASFITPTLTASTTYYVQTIVNGCISSRIPVTVTVNPIPAAPTASGTTICSGNAALLTATAPGGNYEWYANSLGGTALASGDIFTTTALTATTTYYVQTTVNGCTGPRRSVTVTVIPTPAAPTVVHPVICAGTSATLTATAPGGSYKWYDAAAAGNLLSSTANYITPVLTTTTVYYLETTVNGCTSARTAVTVTVNPLPAAPTVSGGTICSGNATTLTATAPGGVYRWYSAAVSGTLLTTNASYTTPVLTTTTTYYVEAVSAQGCSGPRTSVTVTVTPEENADFSYSSGTYCVTSPGDETPTVINPLGGTFSSTPIGLLIDPSTGKIDVNSSAVGTYTITFVTNTTCVNSSSYNITITGAPDATFTYPGPYCQGQSSPALPVFPTGASAGVFSSTTGLVFLNDLTGEIDLQTSTPGTYLVTNTIAAIGSCLAATATSSVTINPTPTVTSAAAGVICNDTPQSYQITSDVSGTSYTWSRAFVTGINNAAATAQTSATITEQLENSTSAPIDVVYLITPSAIGCDGTVFTYTVKVNPTPVVTSALTETLCDNVPQNYTITSNVAGTSYKWSRALVSGIDNPAVSAQTSDVITEQLDNTTNLPINVIYNIVPSANGCDGPMFTYTVTVNPTPLVTSASSAPICNNMAQSYAFTSNVGVATYTWSRAAVAGISNAAASVQTGTSITETLVNTTALSIPVVYQITASAYGCDGPVFTYTVTVNPTPVVTSASSETLCNNIAQSYAFTSNVGVAIYTWSRAAVAGISNVQVSAQTGTSITETLVNTTALPIDVIYNIVPSAYGCDGPAFTYTVTVNPTPVVMSVATASICSNTPQNYTISGNVSVASYTWSRAVVSGISNTAVSNQAGPISEALTNTTNLPVDVVYTIYPTAYGCDGPVFTYTVTVNPTPVVTSLPSLTICNSAAQSYEFTSNVGVTTYTWSRAAVLGISNGPETAQAGTSITETLINTTNLPVNVTYNIVPSAYGCNGPAFTYTVKVNPTPTVTSQLSRTICNNIAHSYTITSNLSSTYSWSRASVTGISNGAVSAQTSDVITETLVNATNLPVNVIYNIVPSANGCDGPVFTYTVTVNPTPVVTSASSAPSCNNTDQNYTFTSNVGIATYTWSRAAVAGISNAPAPVQTGTAITEKLVNTTTLPIAVVYQITASAYGCSGPVFTYTVTVNPTPVVTSISNIALCNKIAQNYTITSNVGVATYTWSRALVNGISNVQVSAQTSDVITEQLENTTALPIDVIYNIVPSAYGCDGPVFTYTVTVNPTPVVTSTGTASICNSTPQNYTITGNVSAATYTWSRAVVSGISNTTVSNQSGPVISETLTNTTSAPIAVVYEIIPSAYGCNGPMFNYIITVNPTPTVTSAAAGVICNDTPQSYQITSDVSGTSYTWSRAFVTGINNAAAMAQTSATITEQLENSTSAPIDVVYLITPSAIGCDGTVFTYTVKVNPTPVVTSALTEALCDNVPQNYTITSNVAGTSYKWSRALVSGIDNPAVSAQTSDVITEQLDNTTNLPINVIYNIVPSANGCDGPMFTYTVTVNPTPLVTSASSAPICNNMAQSYAFTSNVGVATYTWSRAAVAGISNAAASVQTGTSITETLVNTTALPIPVVYQITASAYGCDGPVFTYTVTVNPTPVVTSASSETLCNNIAQSYAFTSNVGVATYTWSRAAVAGISNVQVSAQTGTSITETLVNTTALPIDVIYNIVPSAYGCNGPAFTYTVTVNPTPVVMSVATASICSNTPQNYTISGNVSVASYTWSRAVVSGISNTAVSNQAGPVILETLINTTSSPIAVVYDITPSAYGCNGPVFNYTITVNPTATVTSAATAVICNQTAQNYQISSDVTGTSYTWSRAAVSGVSNAATTAQTGASIAETLINTTNLPVNVTYNIVPSAYGCSGPAFSYTITVNPTPRITSLTSATICNNTAQNYSITSNVSGAGFTWSRATVAGISNLAATAQTSDVITETLVNTTSASINVIYRIVPAAYTCEGPVFTYTVRVDPTSVITSSASATICNNTAQNYTVTSNVSGAVFTWSRAMVAGISNPPATAQTSNITETLVNTSNLPIVVPYQIIPAINGCSGLAFTYNLTVNPTPRITNTFLSQVVCSTSSSTAVIPQSNVAGTNFSWTATATPGVTGFIASGTGTIPAQRLRNTLPGSGTITYTIRPSFDGCTGVAANYVITVLNQVPVTPLVSNNSPLCVGKSLSLSTQQVTGATYSWTGPNGFTSTSRTPVINNIAVADEGVYTATITVGQCSASANTTVIVNRPAIVAAGNDQTVCANNAVIEISGTVGGGSTTGIWTSSGSGSFPSGTTVLSGTYVPSDADKTAGDVVLTLTATNTASCEATAASFRLFITPTPVISAGGNRVICAYEPLVLTGQSTTANVKWTSSGSGTFLPSNTSLNANYTPSRNDKINGSVTITLSTAGPSNCIPVTDQINLVIVPAPTVELGDDVYAFEGESKVLNPLEITGNDLKYLWTPNINLNDNTLRNPTFTGTRDIRYTLTVTGTAGCKVVDRFFVKVLKPITIPNAFSPNGDGINDTWTPKEIDNYPGAVISIFNRYGVKLYGGHARDIAWDGTYKGSPLPVGTYYYILDLKEYGKSMSGNVTIIR